MSIQIIREERAEPEGGQALGRGGGVPIRSESTPERDRIDEGRAAETSDQIERIEQSHRCGFVTITDPDGDGAVETVTVYPPFENGIEPCSISLTPTFNDDLEDFGIERYPNLGENDFDVRAAAKSAAGNTFELTWQCWEGEFSFDECWFPDTWHDSTSSCAPFARNLDMRSGSELLFQAFKVNNYVFVAQTAMIDTNNDTLYRYSLPDMGSDPIQEWSTRAQMSTDVYGPCVNGVVNNTLYRFVPVPGEDIPCAAYSYNNTLDEWTQVGATPFETIMENESRSVSTPSGVVITGVGMPSDTDWRDTYLWDGSTYTQLASYPGTMPRHYSLLYHEDDNDVYLLAGNDSGTGWYCLDLDTDTWESIADCMIPPGTDSDDHLMDPAVVFTEGRMLVICGRRYFKGALQQSIREYDAASGLSNTSWATIPTAVYGAGAIDHNGTIIVFAGSTASDVPTDMTQGYHPPWGAINPFEVSS